jgi:hypothetical protein
MGAAAAAAAAVVVVMASARVKTQCHCLRLRTLSVETEFQRSFILEYSASSSEVHIFGLHEDDNGLLACSTISSGGDIPAQTTNSSTNKSDSCYCSKTQQYLVHTNKDDTVTAAGAAAATATASPTKATNATVVNHSWTWTKAPPWPPSALSIVPQSDRQDSAL